MSELSQRRLQSARFQAHRAALVCLIGIALLISVVVGSVLVTASDSGERFTPPVGYPASPYAGGGIDEAAVAASIARD